MATKILHVPRPGLCLLLTREAPLGGDLMHTTVIVLVALVTVVGDDRVHVVVGVTAPPDH